MLTWEKMYQLQQLEKFIENKRKNKELSCKFNTLKKEKEVIQGEINSLKEEKDIYDILKNRIRKLEAEIEDLKSLAKEHEAKLYSGDITNNKELITAKEHLDQYQDSIANLENDLIKLMEEQEMGKKELEDKNKKIKERKSNFHSEYSEYQTSKEKDISEILEKEEELSMLKKSIAEEQRDYLELYENLKGKYSFGVIAKLENSICSGCHMGVSFEVMKDIRKTDLKRPVYCNNCGRIVIL